jgi:hypothetical protein
MYVYVFLKAPGTVAIKIQEPAFPRDVSIKAGTPDKAGDIHPPIPNI